VTFTNRRPVRPTGPGDAAGVDAELDNLRSPVTAQPVSHMER
jgi:hypothetical protein